MSFNFKALLIVLLFGAFCAAVLAGEITGPRAPAPPPPGAILVRAVDSDPNGYLYSSALVVCDGDTDETEINAALQSTQPSGGRYVYLLPGTYTLAATDPNGAIRIPSGCTLAGAGYSTHIVLPPTVTGACKMVANLTSYGTGAYDTDITIRGLRLDGRLRYVSANVNDPNLQAADLTDPNNISTRCTAAQKGIYLFRVKRALVEDCYVENLGPGNVIGGVASCIAVQPCAVFDSTFQNLQFRNTVDGFNTGKDANNPATSCSNLRLANSAILSTNRDYAINLYFCDDSLVENNVIRDSWGASINLYGCRRVTFVNTDIAGCRGSGGSTNTGYFHDDPNWQTVLDPNAAAIFTQTTDPNNGAGLIPMASQVTFINTKIRLGSSTTCKYAVRIRAPADGSKLTFLNSDFADGYTTTMIVDPLAQTVNYNTLSDPNNPLPWLKKLGGATSSGSGESPL